MKKYLYILIISIVVLSLCLMQCETKVQEPEVTMPDPVDPGPLGTADNSAIKILFIGNSMTYYNGQPHLFWYMANAAGKKVYVDQATIPGAQLYHHIESDFTMNKIRAQKWDYVILQEAIFELAFYDYQTEICAIIQVMKEKILEKNPQTKIIYFLPWSSRSGVQSSLRFYPYSDFQKLLRDGAVAVAKRMDLIVAPVGWAWYNAFQEKPELILFDRDGSHPAPEGSYLGAGVYYVTIFQETVVNNPYKTLLDSTLANYLQEVATKTVLDSLEYWNINHK